MTPLEAKIAALLVDCEPLLEPVRVTAQKWVIISSSQKQLQTIEDKRSAMSYSYARASASISALPSYATAREAFGRDRVLAEAAKIAGFWATFERLVQYLILSAGRMGRSTVKIDHAEALRVLRSFRDTLTSTHLHFQASARVMGVALRRKALPLPDDLKLYRLSRRERNERQPVLTPYGSSGWDDQAFSDHSTEIRVPVTVPVDQAQEHAFFESHRAAYQVATDLFGRAVQAMLVAATGRIALGPIDIIGGLAGVPVGRLMYREFYFPGTVKIGTTDLPRLRTAYDIVSGGKGGDKTLSRALHRYILGRQRNDLIDQLVDYAIAWESILLTQGGNPITQELSYRFALNGAALLTNATSENDRVRAFRKMKGAYSTRSAIVHGGEGRERDKALQSGAFNSLAELCNFLEGGFREAVFWLSSLKPNSRPYRSPGGWESLIWGARRQKSA